MRMIRFSRRRRLCLAGIIALSGVCFIVIERVPFLCGLGRWLNVAGRVDQPVDTVMVLGGGASTRPFVAREMMHAGLASKVLVFHVQLTNENRDGLEPEEEDVIRQIYLQSGIPAEAIVVLPTEVGSTSDEALQGALWLKAHPRERLAVVTSDFHTRRARVLFSRACGDDARRLVFIAAPTDGFDACNWWQTESGLVSYLTEYLKLARTLVP